MPSFIAWAIAILAAVCTLGDATPTIDVVNEEMLFKADNFCFTSTANGDHTTCIRELEQSNADLRSAIENLAMVFESNQTHLLRRQSTSVEALEDAITSINTTTQSQIANLHQALQQAEQAAANGTSAIERIANHTAMLKMELSVQTEVVALTNTTTHAYTESLVDDLAQIVGNRIGSLTQQLTDIQEQLQDTTTIIRNHSTIHIDQGESLNDTITALDELQVAFDEVDQRLFAGMYTYTFNGWAKGWDEFSYFFAMDFNEDTQYLHDWYLTWEASGGHSGGGSHWTYQKRVVLMNGYCGVINLENPIMSKAGSGSGTWELNRIVTADNGWGPTCTGLQLRHAADPFNVPGGTYAGPYFLKIQSSKQLKMYARAETNPCQISCKTVTEPRRSTPFHCAVSGCPNTIKMEGGYCTDKQVRYAGTDDYNGICSVEGA